MEASLPSSMLTLPGVTFKVRDVARALKGHTRRVCVCCSSAEIPEATSSHNENNENNKNNKLLPLKNVELLRDIFRGNHKEMVNYLK